MDNRWVVAHTSSDRHIIRWSVVDTGTGMVVDPMDFGFATNDFATREQAQALADEINEDIGETNHD